jgi:tRNA1Val (adenine37-N6)-methyltransferase
MGNSWFDFQQFRIHQDRCAMKISTDAVLLGSVSQAENPVNILDIGTGTGVIALMLAQRFPDAAITAVEVDEDAAEQAGENFRESQFATRIDLFQGRIQDFADGAYFDLIVSNPPFFPDHLKSSDPQRNRALHTDELSFSELVDKVSNLLTDRGVFWVILPPRQLLDLTSLAAKAGLQPFLLLKIKDSPSKPVYREICGFSRLPSSKTESVLSLKDEHGSYSESYSKLLSGFLLGY